MYTFYIVYILYRMYTYIYIAAFLHLFLTIVKLKIVMNDNFQKQ